MIKFTLNLLICSLFFAQSQKPVSIFTKSKLANVKNDQLRTIVAPQKLAVSTKIYQDYSFSIKAGNDDISLKNNPALSYLKNYIEFKVKVPPSQNAKYIFLKYCITTGADSVWQTTDPGETTINFATLMPGNYSFKAYAIESLSGVSKYSVHYTFHIVPPWWQQFWFKLIFFTCILLLLNYLFINYNLNQFVLKKAFYEQQRSIRAERQRISSEIHDDIGSGLFAIHLFADLATKKRSDVEEIKQISKMVSEMTDKIKEIIWSTNVENDNLENLLYYIQFQVTRLFEHSDIHFESTIPDDIVGMDVNSQSRRNIFLIIMELAHNALKHSKASNVQMDISISAEFLNLSINDDGIGFNIYNLKKNAMGLENVRLRVKTLKGSFDLQNINGSYLNVKIPLSEITSVNYIYKRQRWHLLLTDMFFRKSTNDVKKHNN